ncbi:hypothetical protein CKM354_000972200 [Cercospora kikuchii]|uniref:Uncharacterized protein n=1 Tax=Cercospora kikuchii TaxID=84275 RepID=A0A9P3CNU7_9PEZI|nr:uncharacterized protein CKM354_000972200 [Cercospora kikuchii]GIZ46602.1 hypothetical protein CKM354_000972200 [Cercospora kikuchii]
MQIDAQERSSLISNVGQWRDMLCADPRDRLYALLGLIDWTKSECEPIVPDYSKSAWDIAVDLAEPLGLIQIQACLRAFQLDAHHVDMLAAVRKQRDLLGQEKAGRAVPSSTQLIKDTALSDFEDFSLVHCARLYLSEDGKLSARVRRSEAYFDVASPKKFLEFARSADERTEVLSQIKDFTLVYARGALAGLLCAGAKSGDILIPIGSTSRCVCLVVRPQTSGEELCDVIGQGFLMNYYCLDPHDNKPGCECYSTLKSNRKIFLANPTIRLTAEEALVLIGQDFEEGTGRTNKYNARARMLRLVTPPVAQPFGVVNLLTRAASWGSDSIDLEELSDNWIDESSSEDTSDHTDQSESDESSDEGHIGD